MPHQFQIIDCKKCGESYCPVCKEECPKCGEKDNVKNFRKNKDFELGRNNLDRIGSAFYGYDVLYLKCLTGAKNGSLI